ncbi:MAG: hypothetical protein ACI4RV_03740, partial [Eubacteriales bacterium]
MKKTIVSVLLTVCIVLTAFPVAAFELEQPETASAAEVTVGTSASSAELSAALPTEHETYGTLVYFEDFSGTAETVFDNLADVKVVKTGSASSKGDSACVQLDKISYDPTTIGVELAPADGGTNWKYTDGTPITGELTVAAEMYLDSSTVPNLFTVAYPGTTWGKYYTPWDGHTLKSQEWVTLYGRPQSTASYSVIGLATNAWQAVYMRSVALYVKNPTNALCLIDQNGENREFILVTDETYTFPGTFAGQTIEQWTDGTSFYAAGEQVNLADVAAKTFSPVVLPDSYSATYGQLVYYRDYTSGRGLTNCALADAKIVKLSGLSEKGDSHCVQLNQLQASPSTVGVEFAPADGGTVWQYADGTPLTGELTVAADMYLNSSTVPNLFTVAYPGTAWNDYYTPWDGHTLKSQEWVSLYGRALSTDSYSRIGLATNAWQEVYMRSVALYVKNPTNALWLTDQNGKNREFILVTDETYTFPDTFAGRTTEQWTDGTSFYAAGEQANLADIAAKTFSPVVLPETYSETYGQLVYYRDYTSGRGLTTCALADAKIVKLSGLSEKGDSYCVQLNQLQASPS